MLLFGNTSIWLSLFCIRFNHQGIVVFQLYTETPYNRAYRYASVSALVRHRCTALHRRMRCCLPAIASFGNAECAESHNKNGQCCNNKNGRERYSIIAFLSAIVALMRCTACAVFSYTATRFPVWQYQTSTSA